MTRVIPDDVRVLLDTEATDLALEVGIDAAHAVVEDTIVGHPDQPGEATLELVERFLAAHFLSPAEPEVTRVEVADVSVSYDENDDAEGTRGIAETRWGRRAIDIDPTGELENAGKPAAMFQTFGHDADDW